jgi:peptidoglycan/xylan/chitin deacetylase (PgdA/CDA1 family)
MFRHRGALWVALVFGASAAVVAADASLPLIVEHGPRDGEMIALTFDACPTGNEDEYDEKVIEVLEKETVPATLFLSGRWVEKNAGKARDLASRPQFEIGNHAYWHPHLTGKDDDRVLRELKRTQAVIGKVTGQQPRYFRPPYGEVDERVAKLAKEAGLVTVQYDIASGDPDPALAPARIIRAVLGEARGGSIVVFHMNGKGAHTAEVLPAIITGLRQKGYELTTVGDLLNGPAPTAPRN